MSDYVTLEVQSGKETAWGTSVTPTAKLMGVEKISLKPKVEAVKYPDQRGSYAPGFIADIAKVSGEGSFESLLTYEDVNYWLEGVVGAVTPSGAGPYTRDGSAPLGSEATPRSQTIAYGNSDGVYGGNGVIPSKLSLKFPYGDVARVSGDLLAKEVVGDALAVLSDRTVNPVMGDQVSLYIDAWAGTVGTTQFTDTIFSVEIEIDAQKSLKHGLGSLTPVDHKGMAWMGVLKARLEFGAASKAYLDAIVAGSALFQRQVRVEMSNGTESAYFDFAGYSPEGPEVFSEEDGVVAVEFTLEGLYNPAMGNWFAYQTINAVSALP